MAIIKNGILGGFQGKVGPVVGYRLRDQDIMRSVGEGRKAPYTPGELNNQNLFAVSQIWLQPLIGFLRVGFQGYDERYEGFNAAKSYNSKNAMRSDDAGVYVDPELALLSYGDIDLADTASVVCESPHTVTFKWEGGRREHDDRAMYVLYDIEGGRAAYETAGAKRQFEIGEFKAGEDFSGKTVHAYIAFVSEDRKRRSNSQYLGLVKVL